ncbi:MAG: hypothetical protein H6600_05775 [Flavobacteriales bacterium]|nr:hypothetical protein [Flavobacteriales bacterium]
MKNIIFIISLILVNSMTFGQVEIVSTGISGAYSINHPSNVVALTNGLSFTFKANHTNTGASSLSVNGLPSVTIYKAVSTDLDAGDIQMDQIVTVVYDGVNFQMTSALGNTSGGGMTAAGSDGDVQFNSGGVLNGSAALRWDNTNQRLGIGTNAPQERLEVEFGNILMDDGYNITWGIVPAPYIQGSDGSDYLAFGTSAGEKMRINSNGKIGIGSTAPGNMLSIVAQGSDGFEMQTYGNSNTNMMSYIHYGGTIGSPTPTLGGTVTHTQLYLGYEGASDIEGAKFEVIAEADYTSSSAPTTMRFLTTAAGATSSTERMRITSQGYLGVGTAIPMAKVDIDGDINLGGLSTSPSPSMSSEGKIYFDATSQKFKVSEDGGAWVDLVSGNNGWSLDGNAGTVDGTNFIGTIDNVPLNFKANNQNAGRIETSIGTGNTFIGYTAGNINTGIYNSVMGYRALFNNQGGQRNTGLGGSVMFSNQTGSYNTAMGIDALADNVSSGNNSAFGASALNNTLGANNSGFGSNTGLTNTSGSANTFIGSNADATAATLTNATAIGARAAVGTSNSLVLGAISGVNGASSNTNVGIGTTTPNERLEVNGGVKIGVAVQSSAGTLQWNGSNLQYHDGTSWQTITSGGDFYANGSTPMTGQFLATTGSVVSPSISFNGNSSTGIYNPSSNQLGFVSGGAEAIRVGSTGFVGIGTTNPFNRLDVNGAAVFRYNTGGISRPPVTHFSIAHTSTMNYLESANGSTPEDVTFQSQSYTFTTGTTSLGEYGTNFYIAEGGNVGVNTNSPTSTFSVLGSQSQSIFTFGGGIITLDATFYNIVYGNVSGTGTVNLPPAASCPGRVYRISKIPGSGIVQIARLNGADFIDGTAANYIIQTSNSVRGIEIISDGVNNWYVVNKFN